MYRFTMRYQDSKGTKVVLFNLGSQAVKEIMTAQRSIDSHSFDVELQPCSYSDMELRELRRVHIA